MLATEKRLRRILELRYLNAENADRYRCLMRAFYEQYDAGRQWLYEEEIYRLLAAEPYFGEYREEQCRQDLAALVEWKNLEVDQDTRNARTIEEFKNRRYRYQLSATSVEIERFIEHLENLHVEGSSLEPSLLERIRLEVEQFPSMAQEPPERAHTWWKDLYGDYERLNQNSKDYIRDLNSVKAEELMKTQAFFLFKDRLIEYLRNFVHSLQNNVGSIEEILAGMDPDLVEQVLEKVVEYQLSIPRLEQEVDRQELLALTQRRYGSLRNWFVGLGGGDNEAGKLFDRTNDIIRRITRYAAQISEQNGLGVNRREEYRKVAELFLGCRDLSQAHCMAAAVFGLERPRHLRSGQTRETDSWNSSVYEEKPLEILLRNRQRSGREKEHRSPIQDTAAQRARVLQETRKKLEKQQKKLAALEKDCRIRFSALPVLEPQVREILLQWVSNGLENGDYQGRTESGRRYHLELQPEQPPCVLHCQDGNLTMPALELVFEEG